MTHSRLDLKLQMLNMHKPVGRVSGQDFGTEDLEREVQLGVGLARNGIRNVLDGVLCEIDIASDYWCACNPSIDESVGPARLIAGLRVDLEGDGVVWNSALVAGIKGDYPWYIGKVPDFGTEFRGQLGEEMELLERLWECCRACNVRVRRNGGIACTWLRCLIGG